MIKFNTPDGEAIVWEMKDLLGGCMNEQERGAGLFVWRNDE